MSHWLLQSSHSLWRDKSFALTVVLTMGIASGVFLWVLSLSWQILLKPLPYPEAEQLHLLQYQRLDGAGKRQSSARAASGGRTALCTTSAMAAVTADRGTVFDNGAGCTTAATTVAGFIASDAGHCDV